MGWNDVKERSGGAGAGFLTLKDGDVRKIHVIDDEPYTFQSVFFNQVKKSAVIDPDNNPLKGVKGFDVRNRHAINVYDYDDQKVKVLAGSNELFNQLKGIHKEWEGFDNLDLKISRHGTGFDTKYQLVPTPKCSWDPSLIEGQELNDLATVFAPTPEETIQSYVEGVDPGTEFDPKKLEQEAAPEVEEFADVDMDVTDEEQFPDLTPEEPAKPARPAVTKTVAQPKPQAPTAKLPGRNELIIKIQSLMKSKVRYKKDGVWKSDLQRIGGKDKQSMSQLGTDDLMRLLKHVQTVK